MKQEAKSKPNKLSGLGNLSKLGKLSSKSWLSYKLHNSRNSHNPKPILTASEEKTLTRIVFSFIGITLTLTLLSGFALTSSNRFAHADNSAQSNVAVSVASYCTMIANVTSAHSATLTGGSYTTGIGSTTLTTYCNDADGFVIYAVGAGDGDDVTELVSSVDDGYNIATGLNTSSGDSNWAMRLDPVSNDYTPTISATYNGVYGVVPNTYTAVATKDSGTDIPYGEISAVGSQLTTTYSVYLSSAQPAGTYTGKVKYVMTHPYTAMAPVDIESALAAAGKSKYKDTGYYAIQDLTSTICDAVGVTGTGSTTQLIDTRDNNVYHVGKLADGNCWLLDNLRLDPTDKDTAANMSENNTNATAAAITNYLNGGSTTTGWSSEAVSDVDSDFNTYTAPHINNASVDTYVTSYGPAATGNVAKVGIYYNYCAATAGTYCYDENSGTGKASNDVCPANWRMPTGGDSGEYQALCTILNGGTACTEGMSMTATNTSSLQYNLSTPLSGVYYDSSAVDWGGNGRFWSSTCIDGNHMYYIYIDSSSVNLLYYGYRMYGRSVRCVAGS